MTAGTEQPRVRRERRIIERPRLMKLLDDSEARIILLLAPAGYGKTTLARQWAKTLSKVVWISCTPAHRDVAALAEAVANGIDSTNDRAMKIVRQFVAAHGNPQRVSRRMSEAVAEQIEAARTQWVFIDDYHELVGAPEAEEFIELLPEYTSSRFLISSRQRPNWARLRRIIYGEISELGREELAMNPGESVELLGQGHSSVELSEQAEGWPAVLALAAKSKHLSVPRGALPDALYQYFAEELFQSADARLQEQLVSLALLPDLAPQTLSSNFGEEARTVIDRATELGFLTSEEIPDMHPLLREFLLQKLREQPESEDRVRRAILACSACGAWDGALRLLSRFRCDDLVEPVLSSAFAPLAQSGRLETLTAFADSFRVSATFPPPSVDVIEAEAAFRDGHLELAADLAARVHPHLSKEHPLRSRASGIEGQCRFLLGSFAEAEIAFVDAIETAHDARDGTEALHGLATTRIFGEREDVESVVQALWRRRHLSPTHLLRAATAEISRRRLAEGIAAPLPLDEALHATSHVEDPRARTAFAYTAAYSLGQRAEYRRGAELVKRFWTDVREYDLEFARPHALWTSAFIHLGLRRFGEAERELQALEDVAANRSLMSHALNARLLRARLLIQTGRTEEALVLTRTDPPAGTYPSWIGEFLATRALILAVDGQVDDARDQAALAKGMSGMCEVRVLAASALAMCDLSEGDTESPIGLVRMAEELGTWDPLVCALRSSRPFADFLASKVECLDSLEDLYGRSNDLALARRAGFRTRANRSPNELLSPRELEVLGLIARGMRNAEIAKALYISQSTAKVHVRHVFEKLGVRSRAQAVARYEMFSQAD